METISFVVGVVGIILTVMGLIMTYKGNSLIRSNNTIDWWQLQNAVLYLSKKLKKNNYIPDIIITPGQKGGIIAQLLIDTLNINIPICSGYILPRETQSNKHFEGCIEISTTKWNVLIPYNTKDFLRKKYNELQHCNNRCSNKNKQTTGYFLENNKSRKYLLSMGASKVNVNDCKYDKVLEIVQKAGKLISANMRFSRKIYSKGTSDYVTDLDKKIETYIVSQIQKIFPFESIVSEENSIRNQDGNYWVLDPIDGTTNLIHQFPSIAISLARIVNNEIEFAVVYNPAMKELFFALKNNGAYLIKSRKKHPIQVSSKKGIQGSLVGFGCPYNKKRTDFLFSIVTKILKTCDDVKRMGPASYDICNVASGRLDAYIELDLQPWDYMAASLILAEAGGKISNFSGNTPQGKSDIVVANAQLLHKILSFVNEK